MVETIGATMADTSKHVEIEPGVFVPRHVRAHFDDVVHSAEAAVEAIVDDGGRAACIGFEVRLTDFGTGSRLTTELGRVPFVSMAERGLRWVGRRLVTTEKGLELVPLNGQVEQMNLSRPQPRRKKRVTSDHLQEVVQIYSATSEAPTRAVMEHFHGLGRWISYSTAARWVMQARDAGLLEGGRKNRQEAQR